MRLRSKTNSIFFALVLALTSSMAYSTDTAEPTQAPDTQKHFSSAVPLETQKLLTQVGHTVLKEILHNDAFDISKSDLFDTVYPQLEPLLTTAQYSSLAAWKPSNVIRWKFSSSDEPYIKTRKNQMVAIIALGWAMTDLAKQQNEFFERGSFSIIDPNHRVTNFLLDYVKLTTGFADPQTVPFLLTSCNFAYRRDPYAHGSSHHKGHCPESQFGIDVRFEPYQGVLKLLPFDSTHLLFAKLDIGSQVEPLLFLKLEDIGMGSVPAMALHGLGFLNSQSHVAAESRREKDIPETITASFKDLQTEAGIQGEFKTIRSMYLKARNLFEETTLGNKAYEDATSLLCELSESTLENKSGQIPALFQNDIQNNQWARNVHEKAKAFLKGINLKYPNGNNHLRVGNEVIVDLSSY